MILALLLLAQQPAPLYDGTWPTHVVSSGTVRIVGDPLDPGDDTIIDTGTSSALREFVLMSQPGDVAAFHGRFDRLSICSGNPSHSWTSVRSQPIQDIRIVGADFTRSEINYIELGDKGGNFDGVSFEHFTFNMTGQSGLKGMKHANGGFVKFQMVDCLTRLQTKWGFRAEGSFGWAFVDVTGFGGGQEHLIYVDNVQGFRAVRVVGAGWKRTLIQLVCRWASSDGVPHTRPSSGNVPIRQCDAYDTGEHGAAAITIAGHPTGRVEIEDCHIDSPYNTGLLAAYLDIKQMELLDPSRKPFVPIGSGFLNDQDRAIDRLILKELSGNLPNTRRNMFAIDSCNEVSVTGGLRPGTRLASVKQIHHFMYRGSGMMGGIGDKSIGLLGIWSPLDPVDEWNTWTPQGVWWSAGGQMDDDAVRAIWTQL